MTILQALVTIILAGIAALPATLLALAGWRQGKLNNVQGVEIKEQTNGTLSTLRSELGAAHADLVVARAEISGLRMALLKHGVGDRRQRPRTRGKRR